MESFDAGGSWSGLLMSGEPNELTVTMDEAIELGEEEFNVMNQIINYVAEVSEATQQLEKQQHQLRVQLQVMRSHRKNMFRNPISSIFAQDDPQSPPSDSNENRLRDEIDLLSQNTQPLHLQSDLYNTPPRSMPLPLPPFASIKPNLPPLLPNGAYLPCIISDAEQAFAVLRPIRIPEHPGWASMPIAANAATAQITGYDPVKDMPLAHYIIMASDEASKQINLKVRLVSKAHLESKLHQQAGVTPILSGVMRLNRKDGRVMEVHMRQQIYFTDTGEPGFSFFVFDRVRLLPNTTQGGNPPVLGTKRKRVALAEEVVETTVTTTTTTTMLDTSLPRPQYVQQPFPATPNINNEDDLPTNPKQRRQV